MGQRRSDCRQGRGRMPPEVIMQAAARVLPAAVAGLITVSATPLAFQPVLNFVGVTAHSWGTWVAPGTDLEDWLDEARGYCEGEDVCDEPRRWTYP